MGNGSCARAMVVEEAEVVAAGLLDVLIHGRRTGTSEHGNLEREGAESKPISRFPFWLRDADDDRVIIHQDAAHEGSKRRIHSGESFRSELDRERRRTAGQIVGRATATFAQRSRAATPWGARKEIGEWPPELTVQEIRILSEASREAVKDHVFNGILIAGGGRVQPLESVTLVFPKLVAAPADLRDRASGGIQLKKESSGPGGTGWLRT